MDYNKLSKLEKIYNILRYGLIFECKVYTVYSLYFDSYLNEYCFEVADESYFLVSDLDICYKAVIGNGY